MHKMELLYLLFSDTLREEMGSLVLKQINGTAASSTSRDFAQFRMFFKYSFIVYPYLDCQHRLRSLV